MASFMSELKRTHTCGALRAADAGKEVVLFGWVENRRDHGGVVFIDLRDREGLTQVSFKPEVSKEAHALASELRHEYCLGVRGTVSSRGSNVNPKLATGEIEVDAAQLEIFSRADTPPFQIADEIDTKEELRLKHRYLDLRRRPLQKNFIVRSKLYQAVRRHLSEQRFLEIETPFMVKYTPGGARNFLVPSRLNPHHFYALAESPQIFKQLFMVAGMDRYFQIVRCFRDEDLRLDRQPEFTQIDMEMSFIVEEDIQTVVEGMMASIWRDVLGVEVKTPFQRMSYDEAIAKYGVDKPDLRYGLPLADVTEAVAQSGFRVFDQAVADRGTVKVLRVSAAEAGDKLSRTYLDSLTELVKPYGAKGVAYARVQAGGAWQAGFAKNMTDASRAQVNALTGAAEGDVLIFIADRARVVNTALGGLRGQLAHRLGLLPPAGAPADKAWRFLWVTDFPLLERNDEDTAWVASHHPFTAPRPQDLEHLESEPGRVRARAYDLVLNGNEVAGGSIRIHQREVQARVFKAIGLTDEDARAKFGFLLDAFKYGPPPHGGIAAGLDRLTMLLCGADSLRDVIAFPKTQKGTDLMTDAPVEVSKRQLDDLFIALKTT
jgi:aspartyl-tRNA synthetase